MIAALTAASAQTKKPVKSKAVVKKECTKEEAEGCCEPAACKDKTALVKKAAVKKVN